ncbi:hemerythrin domain-containing protein [Agromyces sp. SYSU T0242]|uniref:hemerythrin domain-containing protein n=1 Tax=Agromyces litoreus TaxID=3158561 RepID=UPI0033922536
MAERLPSTSDELPEGETVGCDTSDILIVHRIFRWGFREMPKLVRTAPPGDRARAGVVADSVDLVALALHLHHEAEDELLFGKVEARRPACEATVELMREQHRRVAELLGRVESASPRWRDQPDAETAEALAIALDDVGALLGVHLRDEEDDIIPVAAEELSQREWSALGEHGQERIPKDGLPVQLGLMLDAVPEDERSEWFRAHMPAPVRLLWAIMLKRRYTAWHRELFPAGMPEVA